MKLSELGLSEAELSEDSIDSGLFIIEMENFLWRIHEKNKSLNWSNDLIQELRLGIFHLTNGLRLRWRKLEIELDLLWLWNGENLKVSLLTFLIISFLRTKLTFSAKYKIAESTRRLMSRESKKEIELVKIFLITIECLMNNSVKLC